MRLLTRAARTDCCSSCSPARRLDRLHHSSLSLIQPEQMPGVAFIDPRWLLLLSRSRVLSQRYPVREARGNSSSRGEGETDRARHAKRSQQVVRGTARLVKDLDLRPLDRWRASACTRNEKYPFGSCFRVLGSSDSRTAKAMDESHRGARCREGNRVQGMG